MSKRSVPLNDESSLTLNLTPILGCLFLLIPALLLAMEVARFGTIAVEPPQYCGLSEPSDRELPRALRVSVRIHDEAIIARSDVGPEATFARSDEHSLDALEQWAAQLTREYPHSARVEISAEHQVTFQTLIDVMDALRGRSCQLRNVTEADGTPAGCYLWIPIVTT